MNPYFAQSYALDLSGSAGVLFIFAFLCVPLVVRYGARYLIFRSRLRLIKDRNVVVTQYEALPNIPAAFFGVIIDNRNSLQDLIAAILELNIKGFLTMSFRNDRQDFNIQTTSSPRDGLYEHQKYILEILDRASQNGVWAKELGPNLISYNNEFNFLVLKDLQRADYYFFHKNMDIIKASQFYLHIIKRAIIRGLIKPWNWPGLILCVIFPPLAIGWIIFCVIYYNRLGLYNYRAEQWETIWPEVAGYYNYLKVVEAKKRSFELEKVEKFKLKLHDPYLVAAQLQRDWMNIFSVGAREIGASGKEYNTM